MKYLYRDVVEGQTLLPAQAELLYALPDDSSRVGIPGHNHTGIGLGSKLLSRHILMIGAIGSGKSNTMYHAVQAIRKILADRDSLVFFDAKGDYWKHFGQENDIVISPKRRWQTIDGICTRES